MTTRRRLLLAWRHGQLLPGKELAGKRVGVAIDGGRIRLRKVTRKQKGYKDKKKQRRRYKTQWREPKGQTWKKMWPMWCAFGACI